jgi:hypothetical protein
MPDPAPSTPKGYVDSSGAAEIAGVSLGSWQQYRSRGTTPDADLVIGRVPYWRPATIRRWDKARQKGPGRPAKRADT